MLPCVNRTGRYAPSPSGELHLGNLRTAVLAWLFARSQDAELLLRVEGLSPHYLLVLTRPGRLDELTVRVEARPEGADPDAGRRLAALVKHTIGVTVACEVVPAGALDRSQGKAQRVVDLR